jgi:uncharacterized protein (TIRG00374 family)
MEKSASRLTSLLRLIGIGLFFFLVWKLQPDQLIASIGHIRIDLVIIIIVLNFPMLAFKVGRWQFILKSSNINYPFRSATLSFFASIFVGLLTPGRLGEFVRAWQVSHDCQVSVAEVFPSVLLDRLFDLYAALIISSLALLSLAATKSQIALLTVILMTLCLTLPLVMFLHPPIYTFFEGIVNRYALPGKKLFKPDGWLTQLHAKLRKIDFPILLICILYTVASNIVFFFQSYLLAQSLGIEISIFEAASAVQLGSLVTLIPISISGLGTREATIVAYLAPLHVVGSHALGFSLATFIVMNVAGALMGAIAWSIKPFDFRAVRMRIR